VGFYDAHDAHSSDWYYNTLGGNQDNRVKVKPYPKSRFLGAYWPAAHPLPEGAKLFGSDYAMV
jgi:hypothetical protein